jgi:hypothetical protein
MGVDNAQHEACRYCGIDGVAAFPERLDACARGQLVNCCDNTFFKLLASA